MLVFYSSMDLYGFVLPVGVELSLDFVSQCIWLMQKINCLYPRKENVVQEIGIRVLSVNLILCV